MPTLPRVVDRRVDVVADAHLGEVLQETVDRHPAEKYTNELIKIFDNIFLLAQLERSTRGWI